MDKDFVNGLEKLFNQGFVEKEFEFADHKWKIRTLNDLEKVWADQFIDLGMATSFLSARRVPTLAIAIKAIDGRTIPDLFGTGRKPMTDSLRETIMRDPFRSDDSFLAADNLREFLDKQPTAVIDRLYSFYYQLESSADTTLKTLLKEDEFFRGASEAVSDAPDEAISNDGDGVVADKS